MWKNLQRVSALAPQGRRALSSQQPYLPRITDRRLQEQGPGGRASNAGIRVAIFGATGFLGKHVCNQLGMCQDGMEWTETGCLEVVLQKCWIHTVSSELGFCLVLWWWTKYGIRGSFVMFVCSCNFIVIVETSLSLSLSWFQSPKSYPHLDCSRQEWCLCLRWQSWWWSRTSRY